MMTDASQVVSGPERIVRELQAHGWGCNTVTAPEICAAILTLKSENEALRSALSDAAEDIEELIEYVPDYHRKKWGHDEYAARIRRML